MASSTENIDKGNILVVDDSPDNLRILSTSLTTIGYKVRCVTNGEMALISIASYKPDLVLLDIRMPTLDGYAVCKKIKSNPRTKDIPVIFLSAVDDVVDKVKAFELGGVDYVTKPFHADEVLARIANQLTIQRLQNQLATQNQKLQQEVDAHKRTEAALQAAKEAAEIANHAKSNFIARISHELRTPLNAILGFSGLMDNSPSLSEEHQGYVLSIRQSARHLLKVINQILSITKGESNQILLNEQIFNLHEFLKAMASAWQIQAQRKGLHFIFSLGAEVPSYIQSDDGKLRQVLIQLLDNAIKFTDSGQVSLRISMAAASWHGTPPADGAEHGAAQDGLALVFEIEDTGAGIADPEIHQLFQAFSQTESGRKLERGLGLGLYICHQYIQAMDGKIALASVPGQGTNVRFCIPVKPGLPGLTQDMPIFPGEVYAVDGLAPTVSLISLNAAEELILEALAEGLTIDWVNQVNRAAIQGSDHQIKKLIQDISAIYLALADVISEWNNNFQFDQIIAVTQRILDQGL